MPALRRCICGWEDSSHVKNEAPRWLSRGFEEQEKAIDTTSTAITF
jgi:hypothetical protein